MIVGVGVHGVVCLFFFFQAEDGIRDLADGRGRNDSTATVSKKNETPRRHPTANYAPECSHHLSGAVRSKHRAANAPAFAMGLPARKRMELSEFDPAPRS